jgi:hypothetical protein
MSATRPDAPVTMEQFREDLLTTVTVIFGQTQLLQRRLNAITELSRDDRRRFQAGLAAILGAARQMGNAIRELPNTSREWPGG